MSTARGELWFTTDQSLPRRYRMDMNVRLRPASSETLHCLDRLQGLHNLVAHMNTIGLGGPSETTYSPSLARGDSNCLVNLTCCTAKLRPNLK